MTTTTANLDIGYVTASQNQKEVTINAAFDAIDAALSDQFAVSFTSNAASITTDEFVGNVGFLCSSLSAAGTLTVPASKRLFFVNNSANTADAVAVTNGGTGATASIDGGMTSLCYNDGTNIVAIAGGGSGGTLTIPAGTAGELLAATGTAGVAETIAVSTVLDTIGSTEGDILYRGSSGWVVLAPGTSGEVLQSGGPAAAPSWNAAAAGATIPAGTAGALLAATGTAGTAETIGISTVLDTIGSTEGDVLYRGVSGWVALAPGTSGQVLQSGGTGASPSWLSLAGDTLTVSNNGTSLGTVGTLDAGSGATLAVSGGIATLTVAGGGGATLTVQQNGTSLGTTGTLDVTTGLTATISGGNVTLAASGIPAGSAGVLLAATGTAGIAETLALSDLLTVASSTLTLAGAAIHEKFLLSIPGTLSASTQYWTIPIADTVVIPASWSSPTSYGASGTEAGSTATTLSASYIHSSTTSSIGTVVFNAGTAAPTLTGPGSAITLSPGNLLVMSTGATVDSTLANVGFTMVATKV